MLESMRAVRESGASSRNTIKNTHNTQIYPASYIFLAGLKYRGGLKFRTYMSSINRRTMSVA